VRCRSKRTGLASATQREDERTTNHGNVTLGITKGLLALKKRITAPERMNSSKRDRVGTRQVDLARRLHEVGLLTKKGLRIVEKAARERRP